MNEANSNVNNKKFCEVFNTEKLVSTIFHLLLSQCKLIGKKCFWAFVHYVIVATVLI